MLRLRPGFGEHPPQEALQPLIDRKIMKLEAEEKGFDEDPLVVAALDQFERQQLVEKLYGEEVSKKVEVADAEIRSYFYQNGLDRKREVRASHIVVATEDEARKIRRELEKGAAFARLAQQVSIDTATAAKGGDMGYWQEEDTLRSPFIRQLFALKEGEVSEPYQDARGNYHLIEATEARPVGLERQKQRIRKILERQKKDQRWTAYLDEQAENARFTVDRATLAFLLRQGRRAVDQIPPVMPEHSGRVLCRYQGGEIDLARYLEMVRDAGQKRRPAPVDSGSVVQFARTAALTTEILPRIAAEQGLKRDEGLRAALENKREEVLVERLRRVEVEERFLPEELLQAYYKDHREDFTAPARTFVEGGILGTLQEARRVAERARAGEELAEIMRSYPLFLGRFRKYDVFNFAPADTARRKDALGAMVEAARSMEPEEIEGPVQIRFPGNQVGLVVLEVLEIQPSHLLPFTAPEVQQVVRRKVRAERYREIETAFEHYMETLRQKYAPRIVVHQHVLDAMSAD